MSAIEKINKKEILKNIGFRVINTTLISIIIFYPFNPLFLLYFVFVSIIWLGINLNFKPIKNSMAYLNFIAIAFTNLLILPFMKHFVHRTLHFNRLNIALYILLVLFYGYMGIRSFYNLRNKEETQDIKKEIFPMRAKDLERIHNYLEKVNSIGINGSWGSGKTFIVNELKNQLEISEKYEFIEIDLLSSNLDEIEIIILNEMEKVLYKNKIFPNYSVKLKRIYKDNKFLDYLEMLLLKEELTYSEALSGFVEELNQLDKTIVIVFEDLDRVTDVIILKKIFSISEKLTRKNVKAIFQYDHFNMKQIGLDRDFLEKYITYIINISPVKFAQVLKKTLKDSNLLKFEDFIYLYNPLNIDRYFAEELGISHFNLSIYTIPIRKIESFVEETELVFNEKEDYYENGYQELVVSFQFIKHFRPDLYELITIEHSLLDNLTFMYQEDEYTLAELIHQREINKVSKEEGLSQTKFKKIFEINENKDKLMLLTLFGYRLDTIWERGNSEEALKLSFKRQEDIAANDKIDRIVWNLLANGKSEYTDFEIAGKIFYEKVLLKPRENQKVAYDNFLDLMFKGDFSTGDNNTIFLMGVSNFPTLAQALRVSKQESEVWVKFIDFYVRYSDKKAIDLELIQILNYSRINSRRDYLDIISIFSDLEIKGHFNNFNVYYEFIIEYLRILSRIGIINTSDLGAIRTNDISTVEEVLKRFRQDILNLKESLDYEIVGKDLEIIIKFIDKNLELIDSNETYVEEKTSMNSEIRSENMNKDEFERLKKLKLEGNPEFTKELEYSYQNEKIAPYEVDRLLKILSEE